MTTAALHPALFTFLRELRENNNREWFQANKGRYEGRRARSAAAVHRGLCAAAARAERALCRRPTARRRVALSDLPRCTVLEGQSPYKTQAAAHFRHERGKDVHAPGFYLHLEPEDVFAGAGIWHPDTKSLTKIRDAIVAHPAGWQRLTSNDEFRRRWQLAGDSLKACPQGLRPQPPAHRGPEAQGLRVGDCLHRGGCLRPRLHGPARAGVSRRWLGGRVLDHLAGPALLAAIGKHRYPRRTARSYRRRAIGPLADGATPP